MHLTSRAPDSSTSRLTQSSEVIAAGSRAFTRASAGRQKSTIMRRAPCSGGCFPIWDLRPARARRHRFAQPQIAAARPNDKSPLIPKSNGVACPISRVQTGGGSGAAEDTSGTCRPVGPIRITGEIKDGERVFDKRRSLSSNAADRACFRSTAHPVHGVARWTTSAGGTCLRAGYL